MYSRSKVEAIRRLKQEHAQGHPEEVYGCEFLDASTEAMQLASCSEEKVFLWDVSTGKQLAGVGPPSDIQHEPTGMLCPPSACMESWRTAADFGLLITALMLSISLRHKWTSQLPSAVVRALARDVGLYCNDKKAVLSGIWVG